MFDFARNRQLSIIWKDKDDFCIIDFYKKRLIHNLSFDKVSDKIINCCIEYPNLKKEFRDVKVMLISSKLFDEKEPVKYNNNIFYIKEDE